jgi:hypothetical protein
VGGRAGGRGRGRAGFDLIDGLTRRRGETVSRGDSAQGHH